MQQDLRVYMQENLPQQKYTIKVIDIDANPELLKKYDWEVPLLFIGDQEVCRHHLESSVLEKYAQRG